MRETMPRARRVAALADSTESFSKIFVEQLQGTAKQLGMELHPIMLKGPTEMNAALPALVKMRPDIAIVHPSLGPATADLVLKQRIATAAPSSVFADTCLVTYSADIPDVYRMAADYVDRILKRGEGCGASAETADEVRADHQPESSANGWDYRAAVGVVAGDEGYRVIGSRLCVEKWATAFS